MACLNPDGTLTPSARTILAALQTASQPEEVARLSGLPLFRIRASLRELVAVGLGADQHGHYTLTELATQHAS